MLLNPYELQQWLNSNTVKGVIHIGAHHCEEKDYYNHFLRVPDSKILWIEGSQTFIDKARSKYPSARIIQALCSNVDNGTVEFMITNNEESSSILEFGTHSHHHPHVVESGRVTMSTITLDTLLHNEDLSGYNMINIDVQGAERLVLEGANNVLKNIDAVYAEVNEEELYKGCTLLPEFDKFMQDLGFERVIIKMTQFKWGDALYIRK